MGKWILVIAGCLGCCACEKAIVFKLDSTESELVVEATIENGQPPMVILSNSYSYFSSISADLLAASFVHGAIITMSNGQKTQQLKEYSVPTPANLNVYYYGPDSSQPASLFAGAFNTTYQLTIKANGQILTASTTIPLLAKKVDSAWWKKAPDNPDSSKVVLVARVADPKGYGNYTRYFTKANSQPFYPGLNSVFDDQITDGTTYTVDVERGVNRNEKLDTKNYSFFSRGDTITLKLSNIDKATFDFWRTMEYSYGSIGNPFSSPTKVLGNINGGLGYFGGYASQYITVTVPK